MRDREIREHFNTLYARESTVASEVEREVLGHAVGLNGYTTFEQARQLEADTEVGPGDWLLDLGAGRGWPGLSIARHSACRLAAVDLPLAALREASASFHRASLGHQASALAAEGAHLPFAPGSFDAAVHADVF